MSSLQPAPRCFLLLLYPPPPLHVLWFLKAWSCEKCVGLTFIWAADRRSWGVKAQPSCSEPALSVELHPKCPTGAEAAVMGSV